jgi:hypothetical protein
MRIEFHNLFHIGCFGSNDPGHEFKNLTWVDVFLKIDFVIFLFFFISGYSNLIIWVAGFVG